MSRWSSTGVEESAERALFERRAQALGSPEVPPLEVVLAAVERDEARGSAEPSRGARARGLVATALAAACVMAVFARMHAVQPRAVIGADVDAGARHAAAEPVLASGATCSMSDGVPTLEPSACFEPAQTVISTPVVAPAAFTPSDDESSSCASCGSCETCGSCESTGP